MCDKHHFAGMIVYAAWAEREPDGISERGYEVEIAPSLTLAS